MARSTARKMFAEAVGVIERRVAARGRPVKAGHSEIPRSRPPGAGRDFAARARALRRRLRASVDSGEAIRAGCDRG